jgi:Nuclease-related domain
VSDPRLPIWIVRALLALAAGVGVTIWQGWRFGLTAAAVVAIADTVYRSRTTSVIPAAVRVTSAQRRTQRRLLLLKTAGYVSLHRRAIPGSESVIDHLVIGPGGVFALDSERWDRRLPVRSVSQELLYHGPYSQRDRLKHARWEASQAAGRLSDALGEKVSVRPAMAIYGPTIPWIVARLDGVDVFGGRRIRKYFRRQSRTSGQTRLDAGQIEDIHVAAAVALPPVR